MFDTVSLHPYLAVHVHTIGEIMKSSYLYLIPPTIVCRHTNGANVGHNGVSEVYVELSSDIATVHQLESIHLHPEQHTSLNIA